MADPTTTTSPHQAKAPQPRPRKTTPETATPFMLRNGAFVAIILGSALAGQVGGTAGTALLLGAVVAGLGAYGLSRRRKKNRSGKDDGSESRTKAGSGGHNSSSGHGSGDRGRGGLAGRLGRALAGKKNGKDQERRSAETGHSGSGGKGKRNNFLSKLAGNKGKGKDKNGESSGKAHGRGFSRSSGLNKSGSGSGRNGFLGKRDSNGNRQGFLGGRGKKNTSGGSKGAGKGWPFGKNKDKVEKGEKKDSKDKKGKNKGKFAQWLQDWLTPESDKAYNSDKSDNYPGDSGGSKENSGIDKGKPEVPFKPPQPGGNGNSSGKGSNNKNSGNSGGSMGELKDIAEQFHAAVKKKKLESLKDAERGVEDYAAAQEIFAAAIPSWANRLQEETPVDPSFTEALTRQQKPATQLAEVMKGLSSVFKKRQANDYQRFEEPRTHEAKADYRANQE